MIHGIEKANINGVSAAVFE